MSGLTSALSACSGWLAVAALLVGIAALVWLAQLQKRVRMVTPDIRRLVREMEGKSFERVLEDLLGNMEFVGSRVGRLEVAAETLSRRMGRTVQRLGLVRFNAEDKLGGELSFALALLDGNRSGLILTSVHTLGECRLYVRPVEQGRCDHGLSEEEQEALGVALEQRPREPAGASRVRRTRWRERERSPRSPSSDSEQKGDNRGE